MYIDRKDQNTCFPTKIIDTEDAFTLFTLFLDYIFESYARYALHYLLRAKCLLGAVLFKLAAIFSASFGVRIPEMFREKEEGIWRQL